MASSAAVCDTFICGSCNTAFSDLVTFLEHKRSTSCGVTLPYSSHAQENATLLAEASTSSVNPPDNNVTLLPGNSHETTSDSTTPLSETATGKKNIFQDMYINVNMLNHYR